MNEMSEIVEPRRRAPDVEALRQSPARFVNREVCWLQFNMRVLEEAGNTNHPLLERLRFVSISANNLDEFFMVRVAGLKGQVRAGHDQAERRRADAGRAARRDRDARAAPPARAAGRTGRRCARSCSTQNVVIHEADDLTADQLNYLQKLFREEIFPVLTPIAVDPAHPFPFIPNLGLHAGVRADAAEARRRR